MKVTIDLETQPNTFDTTLTIADLLALYSRIQSRQKTKSQAMNAWL